MALEKWLVVKGGKWTFLVPTAFLLPIFLYAMTTLVAPHIPALQAYNAEKAYKGGVVHLLWPGKIWAKDPLALASKHFSEEGAADLDHTEEWNYWTAVKYLYRDSPGWPRLRRWRNHCGVRHPPRACGHRR